jgi:TRAP-type C4-dicarboxylate transport system permease small subunit
MTDIPILLLFVGFGAYGCIWGAKRWLRQRKGESQFTLNGQPIPWIVWPLVIFSGLMCIAASVPVLLGQPMWLLDKVFSIIARL